MIFGKEYDLSLWYMLKVKNIYRKKTIDFVRELPEEFLENIRTTYTNGIEKNAGLNDNYNAFYNIQSNDNPSIYYKFYIMCRDLYMYKVRTIDGVDKVVFSLILSPNNSVDIMNLENKHKMALGSIGIGQYPEISFREIDYDIKKTGLGYLLLHNYVLLGNMIEMIFCRPSNINNMPEEMWRDKSYQKKLKKLPFKYIDDKKQLYILNHLSLGHP